MDDVVSLFRDGGPFMWLLLPLGLLSTAVALLVGIVALTGRRIPAVVALPGPVLVVLFGAVANILNVDMIGQAVPFASPEMKGVLAHAGLAVSPVPDTFGLLCAACALGAYAMLGGIASFAAGGNHRDAIRAEQRLGAAFALLLATATMAWHQVLSGGALVHRALAHAAPDVVPTMVAAGLDQQFGALTWALVGGMLGFGALAACAPVFQDLPGSRAAALLLVGLFGVSGYGGLQVVVHQKVAPFTALWSPAALSGLDAVVSDLPRVRAKSQRTDPRVLPPASPLSSIRVWDGARWSPWSADRGAYPEESLPALLAAPARTPASALVQPAWDRGDATLHVLLDDHIPARNLPPELDELRYASQPWHWAERSDALPTGPERILLAAIDGQTLLLGGGGVVSRGTSLQMVRTDFERFARDARNDVPVWFFPGSDWTLQDLVSLCASAQSPDPDTERRPCGVVQTVSPADLPPLE
jgi:hypothetical protein